jgi:hypothetical protein
MLFGDRGSCSHSFAAYSPRELESLAMRFQANHVSTSVAGDYYQVMFEASEDSTEPDSPYLIIQRQFEMPDGGKCYIETHNEEYIGHFRLRRVDFRPDGISVEIGRSRNNAIDVTFGLTSSAFEEVVPVLKIISGDIEPECS